MGKKRCVAANVLYCVRTLLARIAMTRAGLHQMQRVALNQAVITIYSFED